MSKRNIPSPSRRQVVNGILAATAFGATAKLLPGCTTLSEKPQTNNPSPRPNVLLISADDLRPQLGCYGYEGILSPNINTLASQGIVFQNTYCQVPICGPSRISVFTGIRPGWFETHNGIRKDKEFAHVPSLPGLFKDNGYHTLSIGKTYHLPDDDQGSWSETPWFGDYNRYFSPRSKQFMVENLGSEPPFEAADVPDNAYSDGEATDGAIAALNRLKNSDQPFFLSLGFFRPHLAMAAPQKYWDLYQRQDMKLPANQFLPENAPQVAFFNSGGLRAYGGVPKTGAIPDDLGITLLHAYHACVSYIDAQIGRVMAELERLGLRENTIVILWGDHGYQLGEHGIWGKHTLYETALHSPLIVSVPGIPGGKTTGALTELVDIYQSLGELCHIPIPNHVEGTSFVPLLENPDLSWKKAVFSRFQEGKSVRTQRYRYTEWNKLKWPKRLKIEGSPYARMLYDHSVDPMETNNIAELPENQVVIAELQEILDKGWREFQPEK